MQRFQDRSLIDSPSKRTLGDGDESNSYCGMDLKKNGGGGASDEEMDMEI